MAFFRSKQDGDALKRYEHVEENRIFGLLNLSFCSPSLLSLTPTGSL
jgi:hypothetical protein